MNADPINDWNPESNFTDKIQYICTLNPEPAAWESRIETVLDSLIGTSYVPKHNVTAIL